RAKGKAVICVGFLLDPINPVANDADIVNDLVGRLTDCEKFYAETVRFGGRWILIADDAKTVVLFTDPAGSRRVFFTDSLLDERPWCASEPRLLADLFGLQPDTEASSFISRRASSDREFWWPGESSPYKEIKHLLPNHTLDLLKNESPQRFWPDRKLTGFPVDVAVQECSNLLRNLMTSAANRFQLVLAVTAGWDSRVVLAASKEIRHRLSYMTLMQQNQLDNHPDIAVPSAL